MFELIAAVIDKLTPEQLMAVLGRGWVWAILGAALAIAAVIALRPWILGFLLREKYRKRDTTTFRNWQKILPEALLWDFLRQLQSARSCHNHHFAAVDELLEYAPMIGHGFLLPHLRRKSRKFLNTLHKLDVFCEDRLFPMGDSLQRLQPNLRQSSSLSDQEAYDRLAATLVRLVEATGDAYTEFAGAAVEALPEAIAETDAGEQRNAK